LRSVFDFIGDGAQSMMEAFFLLLAATAPQAAADPLAFARAGKVQCASPNLEKKTCRAIARLTLNADGSFQTTTTILIAPQPIITMEVKSVGTVRDGALCGPIRKADFEAASFQMDGKPIDPTTAATIRGQILASIDPLVDKMGCTREVADGAVFRAEVTIDGVARPDMTQRVLWVKPEDGYKLGT
jgi:hypothetical protein